LAVAIYKVWKRVLAQQNLISKGLTYLFHVKPIGRNASSSD